MHGSSYCYEFIGEGDWEGVIDDMWEIVVYNWSGKEGRVGERFIDGLMCVVFHCGDEKYRAVTKASVY